MIVGGSVTVLALGAWYALPYASKAAAGRAESDMRAPRSTPLATRIEQMLTEARVVLPGAQAMLGFQLAIVLTHLT
jgi:hypothetical protein